MASAVASSCPRGSATGQSMYFTPGTWELFAAAQGDGHVACRNGVPGKQLGFFRGCVEAEVLQYVGDLGVDVIPGLGAGRQRDDSASCVVRRQHPTDHRASAVAHAREDDLRGVVGVVGMGMIPPAMQGLAVGSAIFER